MNKKEFIQWFNELLLPLGYKRKGNVWELSGKELLKVIDLQKSMYSSLYYVNYGYIITKLELDGLLSHVNFRLHGKDRQEGDYIMELFDLDSGLDEHRRKEGVKEVLSGIIFQMEKINTESELLEYVIKKMPTKNAIPLCVIRYFDLT